MDKADKAADADRGKDRVEAVADSGALVYVAHLAFPAEAVEVAAVVKVQVEEAVEAVKAGRRKNIADAASRNILSAFSLKMFS